MTTVATAGQASGVVVRRFDETAGWTDEHRLEGGWPTASPGNGGWTTSVVDLETRLEHTTREGALEVPGADTRPAALIGPRLAHYAAWADSGDVLCYVVPDGQALSLRTWRRGETGFRTHLSASPLFPAWVPGTSQLLCHHGASLTAFDAVSGDQRMLSATATGFRTPAVRDDGGSIAWAEVDAGQVHVMTSTLRGEPARAASFPNGIALGFRPGSGELTVAVATSPESGIFGEVVTLAGEEGARRLVKGPLAAFWWAPNGEKIVTLHPTYSGDGRFQARLHDARGRFVGAMESLIPARDTATMIGFFDQFAVSHPCWSADSRWFGICGRTLTEGPHPSFSGGQGDFAWAWDTRTRGLPENLGAATMLAFDRA